MPSTPDQLAARALERLRPLTGKRHLIALAGPPGAGKSTVSEPLCRMLDAEGRRAAVVPMDGFHLDNAILGARGLLKRKGAPETFDAEGFVHLVRRIAAADAPVVYPVFDRHRDIAIAGAAELASDVEFVLFEGNYLLLHVAPWNRLADLWTLSFWIDAPDAVIEKRLIDRWLTEGLDMETARAKVDGNDMPNLRMIRAGSGKADEDLYLGD